MSRKNFKSSNNLGGFTYEHNRTCVHCGAPIPDQAPANRKHCPKTYDENGKVRDCKTKKNRINDHPDRRGYSAIINTHKAISSRIAYLIKMKGYEVTTHDLDTYDIQLSDSIRFTIADNGVLTSTFLNYRIISNPKTKKHKIENHEEYRIDEPIGT